MERKVVCEPADSKGIKSCWRPPVRGCGLDDLKFVPSVWGSAELKPAHRSGRQPCEQPPSAQSEHTVTRKYKKTVGRRVVNFREI